MSASDGNGFAVDGVYYTVFDFSLFRVGDCVIIKIDFCTRVCTIRQANSIYILSGSGHTESSQKNFFRFTTWIGHYAVMRSVSGRIPWSG